MRRGAARRPCSRVPSATRGPGTIVRSSAMRYTRLVRTAGTEPSTFQAARWARDSCSPAREPLELENHLWLPRQDQLRRGLHGLALHVGEHVRSPGGLQHVVKESDAAACVDAAQRARLPAEHEQHAGSRAPVRPALDLSQRCLDFQGGFLRLLRSADPCTQLAHGLRHVGKPRVAVVEHRNRRPSELLLQIRLRAVCHDQVRPEREYLLEVGVEQSAHARQRFDGGG